MFIHSSMPREPLVYLHVALMDHIANNITDIVDYNLHQPGDQPLKEKKNDTAIFYSITSTQKGLQVVAIVDTIKYFPALNRQIFDFNFQIP